MLYKINWYLEYTGTEGDKGAIMALMAVVLRYGNAHRDKRGSGREELEDQRLSK